MRVDWGSQSGSLSVAVFDVPNACGGPMWSMAVTRVLLTLVSSSFLVFPQKDSQEGMSYVSSAAPLFLLVMSTVSFVGSYRTKHVHLTCA